jgi:hypothetical protein
MAHEEDLTMASYRYLGQLAVCQTRAAMFGRVDGRGDEQWTWWLLDKQ